MSFLLISAVLANVARTAKRLQASASIFSFIKPFAYPFASKPALSKRSLSGRSLIASIFMALALTLTACGSSGSSSNSTNNGGYENGSKGDNGNKDNEDDDYNSDLPINELVDTSNLTSAYFGSLYSRRIPIDATKSKYDEKLFAMIGGKVFDENGNVLKDANITILDKATINDKQPNQTTTLINRTEYGSTTTNPKGFYSIPVEGGKELTIRVSKDGYLSVDRNIYVSAQDWTLTPDVTLIKQDDKATLIDLKGDKPQTHVSTIVTDERGSRTASVVFKGSNSVTITDKEGNERTLETISVRATEFKTPSSMPASLPEETAFTYCVDITIDGVKDDENVTFEKPLTLVVDNFLDFPVGAIVPVGYYDRNKGEWIASDNGVIVKLLDYYDKNGDIGSDGVIDSIDSDADGEPDDLNGDGSTFDEVAGLIDNNDKSGSNSNANPNYQIGKTYQYVQITHFTPYDLNYPSLLAGDYRSPNSDDIAGNLDGETPCNEKKNTCSYITAKTQEHHDDIAIAGLDSNIRLHYSSKSTNGYIYTIETPIDTRTAPSTVLKANVVLEIAGNRYEQELKLNKLNNVTFEWNGKDILGNKLSGAIEGTLSVSYLYKLVYMAGSPDFDQAWAKAGETPYTIEGMEGIWFSTSKKVTVLTENSKNDNNEIANGWTIEDDLYLNLRYKGYLSNAETHKYIEGKDGFYFAVDNEPTNRFAYPYLGKNVYYAIWETDNPYDLTIKVFSFDKGDYSDIDTLAALGKSADLYTIFHAHMETAYGGWGLTLIDNGCPNMIGYDSYAYQRDVF